MKSLDRFDYLFAAGFAAAFMAVAAVLWSKTGCPTPVGCESDGHFMIGGAFSCGLLPATYDWGAFFPLLVALVGQATASFFVAGKLVSLAAGGVLAATAYLFGSAHFGSRRVGITAAAIVSTNGYLLFAATLACTDLSMTAALLVALFFAWRALEPEDSGWAALAAGGCGFVAAMIRFQAYPFVFALALGLVFLSPGPWTARLRRGGAFGIGFFAPLAVLMWLLKSWGAPGIGKPLGVEKLLSVLNDFPGSTTPGRGRPDHPALETLHRLGVSGTFTAMVVGFAPLVGLAALPALLRRRRAATLMTAGAAGAYFLGVGWVVEAQHIEIRRVFLIFVPLLALPFSLVVRRLARLAKTPVGAKALPAAVLAVVIGGQVLLSWPGVAPNRVALFSTGFCSESSRAGLVAAAVLGERIEPPCAQVMTTNLGATVALRNVWYHRLAQLDDASLSNLLANQFEGRRRVPQYVFVRDRDPDDLLTPGVVFAVGPRSYQLTPVAEHEGFTLFKLAPGGD
jgi:hypothetical protein